MSAEYDRAQTGEVDQVEVLVLRYPRTESRLLPCSPETAREVVRLWHLMPTAEQARCHDPTYGLRFHRRGALVLEATLCWLCYNIHLVAGGENFYSTFDAAGPAAQALKGLLQGVAAAAGCATDAE